ncbi:Ubiquitin carboxyl-terminal hydrolase 16 [Mortierella sp. AD011]|nr:Ubiquitin carboxyl-terminal hydrolase 16 [Mortierella sp. AD010]KAF9383902.1 Ubiquitin carboxyl-terminal hydrolase 16 [Mortierella sp. AD011]
MPGRKKKANKHKAKAAAPVEAKAGQHPSQNSDDATDSAILEAVMAESAGLASLEDAAISSAIEASLLSAQEHQEELEEDLTEGNDILLDTINEAQFGTGTEKCPHVNDAVKPSAFRKTIGRIKDWDHCQGCLGEHARIKKMPIAFETLNLNDSLNELTESLPADALWICVSCSEINCGRTLKKHAVTHHDTKHDHPLAINLASLDCWCYQCDDQLVTSSGKNPGAQEVQSILSKTLRARQAKMRAASVALAKKSKKVAATPTSTKAKIFTPGLQNLGNTCFFNSVMQVLAETKSLKIILTDKSQPNFARSPSASTESGLGPLTTTFKDTLFTMWKHQGGVVTPRDLFTQIAKRWKVFRGFREQDSHELMRHLLDGIRLEEVDVIKKKLAEEDNPASSSSEIMITSNGHDNTPPKYVPFIDNCFSGELVSVIVCQACKKCSYAYENYLDLSLPVKGTEEVGDGSMRDVLRARSKAAGLDIVVSTDPGDDPNPIAKEDQGSEAHLKHIEKLLKHVPSQSGPGVLSIERSLSQFTSVDVLDGQNKFACENCYKLVKSYGYSTPVSTSDEKKASEKVVIDNQQTEMEGIVDEVKPGPEGEDDDGSKESTSEPDGESLEVKGKSGDAGPSTSKPSQESKYLLRKAYKRYLVSSLPPTLVLHLKRFEQSTSRFGLMRKIEDHVDIPFEIDMSPYCIPASDLVEEDAEEFNQDGRVKVPAAAASWNNEKTSKKYRLYGATVHQGSLASGHYTNYVLSSKVELPPPVVSNDKPSSLYPSIPTPNGADLPDMSLEDILAQQNQKKSGKKKGKPPTVAPPSVPTPAPEAKPEEDKAASVEPEAKEPEDSRQWIHCSDTNVRLASLKEVLASRPYLLYYERY